MVSQMPPGVEFTKNSDCRNWYLKNYSAEPVLYELPGRRFTVSVPTGSMLYLWMSADLLTVEQWQIHPLINPPEFP